MYAQGTDLSKLPFTDTLQPNPLFNPQANAQKNDQQFGKNQWAYSTGKAQPTQTPSLGTAYGQPSTQGSPQQKNPFASMQPGVYSPSGFTPGSNFQQPLATALAQRDAFVQQANQALLPYQAANFTNQNFGPPQFDIAGMRAQANQMVQDGFYNPFQRYFAEQDALNQIGTQAPPSLYGPQPMQADPYQQWLATLPGYQPRDQWMAQQPQATAVPAQPLPRTPDQRGGPRARVGMDSDSEQSGPTPRRPILLSPESRPSTAQPAPSPSQGTPYGQPAPQPSQRGPQIGKRSSPWLDPQELARERAEAQQLRERLNAEQGRIAREREAVALYHRQKQWAADWQWFDNPAVMA